jgi:hypothetical protein
VAKCGKLKAEGRRLKSPYELKAKGGKLKA